MTETQLATAIRGRELVVFAGAGLVADSGIPGWSQLIASLTQTFRESGQLSATGAAAVDDLRTTNSLPMAMEVLVAHVPRSDVVRSLRTLLVPTRDSVVVQAAAGWRPRGLITTNFDRETERVVPAAHNLYRLSNSEADLKLVATAIGSSAPFWWKLHGDLDHALDPLDPKVSAGGAFMVLTRGDFGNLVHGDRGRQLLAGLLAVLQRSPVIFVGYSFTDPDLALLLSWISNNCQFTHPSWFLARQGDRGLLPSALRRIDPVDRWDDLPTWMNQMAAEASRRPRPAPAERTEHAEPTQKELSAYLAISRYLADLEAPEVSERVLAAALFDEMAALGNFELPWLVDRIAAMLGVGPVLAEGLADATIRLLVGYALVVRHGESVRVNPAQRDELQERAETAWTRERAEFFRSAERRLPKGSRALTSEARDALETVILGLCSELGEAMAEWVSRGIGGNVGWPEFEPRLRAHLDSDEDVRIAEALLGVVLAEPSDAEIPYLYRLLAATFLANSVRLNPVAVVHIRSALELYELYLDANVLLPLMVKEHPNHAVTVAVLDQSRKAGVTLNVLSPIFNEVVAHRERARRDLRDMSGDQRQVAELVNALGGHTNVFMQGYARASAAGAIGNQVGYHDYLLRYSNAALTATAEGAGITIVEPQTEATSGDLYAAALTDIRNEWLQRRHQDRDEILNIHEAAQVCHIYLRREASPERRNHIWFLSNETVLQRVFEKSAGRWKLPPTFPYSAWVAFLDSRLPDGAADPAAVVRAILRGRTEAFELPSPVALVRQRAFGNRVTSRAEEDALEFATSDAALMRRLENAQRELSRRGHKPPQPRSMAKAGTNAVAEISDALDTEIVRLNQELARARKRIADLETHRSRDGRIDEGPPRKGKKGPR